MHSQEHPDMSTAVSLGYYVGTQQKLHGGLSAGILLAVHLTLCALLFLEERRPAPAGSTTEALAARARD